MKLLGQEITFPLRAIADKVIDYDDWIVLRVPGVLTDPDGASAMASRIAAAMNEKYWSQQK